MRGLLALQEKAFLFNFFNIFGFGFTLKGSGSPTVQLTGGSGGPEKFKCFFSSFMIQ